MFLTINFWIGSHATKVSESESEIVLQSHHGLQRCSLFIDCFSSSFFFIMWELSSLMVDKEGKTTNLIRHLFRLELPNTEILKYNISLRGAVEMFSSSAMVTWWYQFILLAKQNWLVLHPWGKVDFSSSCWVNCWT